MPIPKHFEIRVPILELLKDGREMTIQSFVEPMALHFKLSEEELNDIYEKGKHKIFSNRVFWALSYLNMSGLVTKPKRGVYKISNEGLEMLKTPEKIDDYIKDEIRKRRSDTNENAQEEQSENSDGLTPEESLLTAVDQIKQSIYSEIISTLLRKKPIEFERFVVELLQQMGYGGELEKSGLVTQYSNDGGIDGIIKEDVLGFGKIHIQAKLYSHGNNIGREDIQKFVGALAVAQSNKWVFITTSKFTAAASEYVDNLNSTSTIVLINGERLAELVYDYGLGMQVERRIEIKKLDSDYWDAILDK